MEGGVWKQDMALKPHVKHITCLPVNPSSYAAKLYVAKLFT